MCYRRLRIVRLRMGIREAFACGSLLPSVVPCRIPVKGGILIVGIRGMLLPKLPLPKLPVAPLSYSLLPVIVIIAVVLRGVTVIIAVVIAILTIAIIRITVAPAWRVTVMPAAVGKHRHDLARLGIDKDTATILVVIDLEFPSLRELDLHGFCRRLLSLRLEWGRNSEVMRQRRIGRRGEHARYSQKGGKDECFADHAQGTPECPGGCHLNQKSPEKAFRNMNRA